VKVRLKGEKGWLSYGLHGCECWDCLCHGWAAGRSSWVTDRPACGYVERRAAAAVAESSCAASPPPPLHSSRRLTRWLGWTRRRTFP
jgi:hypothetical protein